ncbi:DUF7059 domain-containing protein, partial [Oerskovia jenensis]
MSLGEPTIDPRLLPLLRDDLAAASYTVDGVEDFLGPLAAAALHREQAVPALRVARAALGDATGATSSGRKDPRAVLAALFLLGLEVRRADLDAAL